MRPLAFPINPPSASTMAPKVDAVFYTLTAIAFVIAFGVCFCIVYFSFKYRKGARSNRSNPPNRNGKLEAAWIGIPVLLSIGMFVWASRVYFDLYQAPPGAMEIQVVGKQWMWKLAHPDGAREINTLHVPVGRAIKLVMTSQDVIHSFFVPAFRIKQDVLPGRTTTTWFTASKPGRYHLFCAQYCGTDHAAMQGWVVAMEPGAYQEWLRSEQPKDPAVEAGARLFLDVGCSGCHTAGSSVRAPILDGLYGRPVPLKGGAVVIADERYIRDCILQQNHKPVAGFDPVMPSFAGKLSQEQIQQLVAFIKSLSTEERTLSK